MHNKVGRPRKFDEDTALESAMQVFWKKGYEGTSLRDLTKAMQIDRKSIYLTFGDKEALFKKVLDRYNTKQLAFVARAFSRMTLREFLDDFLEGAIRFWTDRTHPETCMTVQNLAVGDEAQPIRRAMIQWRDWRVGTIRARIEQASKEGELPPDIKPDTFARYIAVMMAGLAIQAASGATRPELKRAVAMFRRTMPIKMDVSS